ncbi:Eukaryotic translation initiation factor 5B [Erysiphe neolycopersici]|uniref:Eukaryotic translation initiation factor 5B n=1 Tax=Erysiphe neolycopersici TaxID=212602 RepID=A0A420HT18_9PEZI|nr:Eukaryotic translation initiation factor 5B [Erysiphe neolycopersici]
MPPKKKANKKTEANEQKTETVLEIEKPESQEVEVKDELDDDIAPSGGLMAMMRKRQKQKKIKEVDIDSISNEDNSNKDATKFAEKAPVEASLDDEFEFQEKKSKAKPAQINALVKDDSDGDVGKDGKILTKAQKEKLKKEREKQRKKENAAKKKTKAPVSKSAEPLKSAVEITEVPITSKPTTGGKSKKVPAAIAKLKAQQEALRLQEEENARLVAEEKARIEEEERREAEEAKRREEAKILKKQREKEKIEQQKRDGTYLTRAQREEKLRNEMKLNQMIAAGVKIGGANKGEKKKPTYDRKKKNTRKNPEEAKLEEEKALAEAADRAKLEAERNLAEAAAKAKEESEIATVVKSNDESDLDDWELATLDSKEDVKESWDADSEKEEDLSKKSTSELNGSKALSQQQKKSSETNSDSDNDTSDSSPEDYEATAAKAAIVARKKEAAERREKAHQAALAARSKDNLRSPICCILGHVDTGKTKLLDKIRQTNVQEGEAGGITQQIGATYFPVEAIKTKTAVVNKDNLFDFKVPGLLVIDTPGHESFSNLRSRGSSLCNIAILVVDIMHGLEQQTLESMKLLRDRSTPFIVALNKIDRLYGWKKVDNNGFRESLSLQNKGVQNEFAKRLADTKVAFAEQGFNAELFYENKSMARNVSLVPTSAHTGEGIPDMLKLIIQLTQERMVGSLMYLSEVQATVLEVKAIEGFGMTIDVILSNGILREGDRIVLCGVDGAITTNIRALLTPAPLKELRLKSAYVHNKEVKAALGVKISAPNLDGAIAGSRLMVVGPDDDESEIEEEVISDLGALFSRVEKSGRGVTVQASTLGSLEALLDFLKVSKIPVANVGIGPVFKRDVMNCGIMLEKNKEYAIMLCFDVRVDKEAQLYADEQGIKIFTADIIYHLFDSFTKHMAIIAEKKKEESKMDAVFPCILKTVAVFNKTGPIVVGVDVVEGNLKVHTPIAAVRTNASTGVKEIIQLGRVTGIERDHKPITICKKGQPSVAVKIEMGGHQPTYGRHLEEKDALYSLLSRRSIDVLKDYYRSEVSNEEWLLIKKLKPLFDIP